MSTKPRRAGTDLYVAGDVLNFQFGSESEMRSGIARVAEAYGWIAQQEVEARGWGRIDIVLRAAPGPVESRIAPEFVPLIVELKVDLLKPSDVRKAFQQVDGYSRWWAKEKGEPNTPVLCAHRWDPQLIASVGDAYPTVAFRSVHQVLLGLRTWNPTWFRHSAANRRLEAARQQLAIAEAAVRFMEESDVLGKSREAEARARDAYARSRTDAAVKTFVDAGLVHPDQIQEVDS